MDDPVNILLIEDSRTQAQQVATVLADYEVDVLIANDGPQGLRIVDIYHPALIVLDVNMPGMDGFQVCKRLKRDPENCFIPVIMLTSADSPEDIQSAHNAGADGYIVKDTHAIDRLVQLLKDMRLIQVA